MKKDVIGRSVIVAVVCFVFFTIQAHAYDGWTGSGEIESFRIRPSQVMLARMAAANNPGNCNSNTYLLLRLDGSESAKYIASAIIAAHTAGQKVDFELDGCSGGGSNGNPVIGGIWVNR